MKEISRLVAAALEAAAVPGEDVSPIQLAAEVARGLGASADASEIVRRKSAPAVLVEALGQLTISARLSAARGGPPPPRLVAVFRWLIATLVSWSAETDSSRSSLVAALMVISSFGPDSELIGALPPEIGANEALLAELASNIADLRADYGGVDAPHVPIWEREFAARFVRADAAQDWPQIAASWPRLEPASRPSSIILATVRLLARYDLTRLAEALRGVQQTVIAMQVMSALPVEHRFSVALLAGNSFIAFAAIFSSCRRQQAGTALPQELLAHVTDLLCKVAADDVQWRGCMMVFGRHPPNFAPLQVPLGHALARISHRSAQVYIETLSLNQRQGPGDPSRMAVAECLTAFRERADAERRHELWRAAFQRWAAWRFDAVDPNAHLSEIRWSDLDYAICRYALECLTAAERGQREGGILQSLMKIDGVWHASKSQVVSEWFRLLSELQPYANAQAVADGQHNPDDLSHAFVPAGFQGNRYVDMMFGQALKPIMVADEPRLPT